MWSVVIESPSNASTRAPRMVGWMAAARRRAPEERRLAGCRWSLVPARSRSRLRAPCTAFQVGLPSKTSPYCGANISAVRLAATASATSLLASARCPSDTPAARRCPVPSGSVVRSTSSAAGQGVGHHQRRRGQVVGLDLGVDAALEVAVAGEHRGHAPGSAPVDRPADGSGQRARSCRCRWCSRSPPCGSPVLQVGQQAGALQVAGHHPRAGGQAGLDVGRHLQAPPTALRASRPARQHHRRGWRCWCSW